MLASILAPFGLMLFVAFALADSVLMFLRWEMTSRDGLNNGIPCFELSKAEGETGIVRMSVNLISAIIVVVLFFSGVLIIFLGSVGRSYLSFISWWMTRNFGFLVWCILRGVLGALTGSESIATLVLVFLNPPAFASLDFVILLCGGGRWVMWAYWTFYLLNGVSLIMSYLTGLAVRNQCNMAKKSASTNMLSVFTAIVTAGQLVSLIKIHVQKLQRIFPPALRYGLASHIQVSLPASGRKALLMVGEGDVTIAPADNIETPSGGSSSTVPFIVPSQRLWFYLTLWSALVLVWLSSSIAFNSITLSLFRVHVNERCWTTHAPPSGLTLLGIFNTAQLSVIVITLIALIVTHSLGKLTLRWFCFWVRRNWIFMILSVARGLIVFRLDVPGEGLGESFSYFVTYAFALPIGTSTVDLVLMLQARKIFMLMGRLFILVQMVVASAGYVEGLATDSPCDTSTTSKSKTTFVLSKVRTTVLLLFSLQFLTMLITIKIFTGITTPIVKLSNKDRFLESAVLPGHRMDSLRMSSQEIVIGEVTHL
jgi:hypothetical protein